MVSVMGFDPKVIRNENYRCTMIMCQASIVVQRDSLTPMYPMDAKRKVLNTTVMHVRESVEEILKLLEE